MVNDGMVIYEPTITGVFFDGAEWDDRRNACTVRTRIGNDVHAALKQVKAVFNGLTLDNGGAVINSITDTATGAVNGIVTPGKTITIAGNKIRVVPEGGETLKSCISYTNVDTQETVQQTDIPVINDPGKIVLQLPALDTGFYTVTLRTLFSSASTTLKAPRYITSKIKMEVK